MQCFQKDPNLRVSARKLLKHPWIVNARRSDSVVPKKPTEYEEAVKSVQQWNEALKSPDAGSLRKATRPASSSPGPGKREASSAFVTVAKGPLSIVTPRLTTKDFKSQENQADDNWDNDFASAISPSALQLPHLRPHDNFGGLLSAEKLKAYASFETVTEEANWDENFEGDLTVKSPLQLTNLDPMKTIRPYQPQRVLSELTRDFSMAKSQEEKRSPVASRLRTRATRTSGKLKGPQEPAAVPPLSSEKKGLGSSNTLSPSDRPVADRQLSAQKVALRLLVDQYVSLLIFREMMSSRLGYSNLLICMDLFSQRSQVVVCGASPFLLDNRSCDERVRLWRSKGTPRMRMMKTFPIS